MGSKTKFLVAGALVLGLVTGAGLGFFAWRGANELTESTAFDRPLETTGGPTTVDPLPEGDPNAQGAQSDSSGPSWRTNEVRINQEQAEGIARTRFEDARVLHAELDEEDGYFLWEVLIQRADGSYLEVFIDAGNGHILGIDHEGFDD